MRLSLIEFDLNFIIPEVLFWSNSVTKFGTGFMSLKPKLAQFLNILALNAVLPDKCLADKVKVAPQTPNCMFNGQQSNLLCLGTDSETSKSTPGSSKESKMTKTKSPKSGKEAKVAEDVDDEEDWRCKAIVSTFVPELNLR